MEARNNFEVIKGLWQGLVPFRIEIFVLFVMLGGINTKMRLHHLGIIQDSNLYCPLCNSSQEDISHLFLHCEFSSHL